MCTNIMLEGDICSNRLSNKQLLQDSQYQQERMVLNWMELENTGKNTCYYCQPCSCIFPKKHPNHFNLLREVVIRRKKEQEFKNQYEMFMRFTSTLFRRKYLSRVSQVIQTITFKVNIMIPYRLFWWQAELSGIFPTQQCLSQVSCLSKNSGLSDAASYNSWYCHLISTTPSHFRQHYLGVMSFNETLSDSLPDKDWMMYYQKSCFNLLTSIACVWMQHCTTLWVWPCLMNHLVLPTSFLYH